MSAGSVRLDCNAAAHINKHYGIKCIHTETHRQLQHETPVRTCRFSADTMIRVQKYVFSASPDCLYSELNFLFIAILTLVFFLMLTFDESLLIT